jgi:hypothetical protein
MPSKNLRHVLVTPEDHAWMMSQEGTMSEVVSSLVARAKDSQKRKGYMRDLRMARARLGRR